MSDTIVALVSAIAAIMTAVATILGILFRGRGTRLAEAAEKIKSSEGIIRTTTIGIEELAEDIKKTLALVKDAKYVEAISQIPDVKKHLQELAEEMGTQPDLKNFLVNTGLSKP